MESKISMLIENVYSYNAYIMLLVFLFFLCRVTICKIPQKPKIVDLLESDDK